MVLVVLRSLPTWCCCLCRHGAVHSWLTGAVARTVAAVVVAAVVVVRLLLTTCCLSHQL